MNRLTLRLLGTPERVLDKKRKPRGMTWMTAAVSAARNHPSHRHPPPAKRQDLEPYSSKTLESAFHWFLLPESPCSQ